MPIYYFSAFNDVQGESPDRDGTELPDLDMAGREAMRLLGTLIADSASTKRYPKAWHVDVTDRDGTTLFNLDFTIRPASDRSTQNLPFTRNLHRDGVGAR